MALFSKPLIVRCTNLFDSHSSLIKLMKENFFPLVNCDIFVLSLQQYIAYQYKQLIASNRFYAFLGYMTNYYNLVSLRIMLT